MSDGVPGEGRAAEGSDDARTTIAVEFDLTPEEWVELALEHNRRSPMYRNAIRSGQRSFGLLVVLLALLGLLNGYGLFAMTFLFVGAGVTVFLPRILERSHRKQYEKLARQGIQNGMFGTHRIELLDEGVFDDTDAYRKLTRWHAIDRVAEGPGAFLIYLGSDAFLPIPHSAFRDAETLRAFADRFFERVGKGQEVGEGSEGRIGS